MSGHLFVTSWKKDRCKALCGILLVSVIVSILASAIQKETKAAAPLIILSAYSRTMDIGDEFFLKAVTSDLSFPKYKSSSSAVASVDANGRITAKKDGTCRITVKSGSSEVYCQIQVRKTTITLNQTKVSLERGETFALSAVTSNGHTPSFRCSKKSIALVSEKGLITAMKPGEAVITVKADRTEVYCRLTVKKPAITLSHTTVSLYRKQTIKLSAKVSSGMAPVWKSSKKSIAVVDENGLVTAVKHGTSAITAAVDGVKKECIVTVKSPVIRLSKTTVTLKAGEQFQLSAVVSSGISPEWSSSKSSIAEIDQTGMITAKKKGTALIRAKEDGTTVSCAITVE